MQVPRGVEEIEERQVFKSALWVEFGAEAVVEILEVFPVFFGVGSDDVGGSEAVLDGVLRNAGFAFDRFGAGGFLRVRLIRNDLRFE